MLKLKNLVKYGGIALGTLLVVVALAKAATILYNAALVDETALTYDKTYTLDLQSVGITSLSAQAVYSSATIPSQTFQDGTQSTGSLTVVTNTALTAASAVNQITVTDNAGLSRASLIFPGYVLQQGIDWTVLDVASNTAESIKTALLTIPGMQASRTAGTAVVYATAPAPGTYYNTWPVVSSTPTALTVATPFFTGGRNRANIAINGIVLQQGINWSTGATAGLTAVNVAAAINANAILNKLVTAEASGAVITATSTLAGVNAFSLRSSTPTALSVSNPAMIGGTAPSFGLNGQIAIPTHGFTTALQLLYTAGSVDIGGLTDQTTYYAVPLDANTIGLSSTSAVAQTGNYLAFTSSTTQLTANTATLAPLEIAGIPSFKWEASNDNANWSDVAVSSVTMGDTGTPYATPPTNTIWSFGYIGPRYLRLNVVAPTAGGIYLNVRVVGTN